jgi:putative membrane protein
LEEIDMKHILAGVCCLALCGLPAMGQRHAAKTAGAAMTDQQFVDFAGQTDMVEAHLGQEAQTASNSQDIKDYGQMLVTDHTKDFADLHTAAQTAGLTVPDAIDAKHHQEMIAPFEKLKGAAFDHKYIHEMIAGHTKALAVYQKEATDAQNDAIKNYAQTAIPVLQKHLDGAKDLEKGATK